MELHVTFRGLCLFVVRNDRTHVDVLFLDTSGHSAPHVHHPHVKYLGLPTGRPLRVRALHMEALPPGNGLPSGSLPNVLQAGAFAGRTVPPGKLGDHPGSTVASRITLPAPARVVPGKAVRWAYLENGRWKCVMLTHEATFKYDDVPGQLRVRTKVLGNPGDVEDFPEPQALPGKPIEVFVTHLPPTDPLVCAGSPPTHLRMYYDFLGGPGPELRLDQKTGLPSCAAAEAGFQPRCPSPTEESLDCDETGTAYNCMLGQASPG